VAVEQDSEEVGKTVERAVGTSLAQDQQVTAFAQNAVIGKLTG